MGGRKSSREQGAKAKHKPEPSFSQQNVEEKYSFISCNNLDQVIVTLSRAGLESSNLIVGIDFTKSNEWTGSKSYHSRSLHHIGNSLNPYEQAISIIGKTLAPFSEDDLIPCYGFGDAITQDQHVFSFYPEDKSCNGFEDVLGRYREIVPQLTLAGPTSFAPVIEQAMTIVEKSGGRYHVLLIIADGQVGGGTVHGKSIQEKKTVDAIVQASKLALSIVLVGVGDGPWDMMKKFDDNIPQREFNNFQFVNFTEIMSKNVPLNPKEAECALTALMEIPSQYKATLELNLLGNQRGNLPQRVALPPPIRESSSCSSSKSSHSASLQKGSTSNNGHSSHVKSVPSNGQTSTDHKSAATSNSTHDDQLCPISLTNSKNMAFDCGHQTCHECGKTI